MISVWHMMFKPACSGGIFFIDWREQSYPKWMQPADIYQSECLGTNAVHARALTVLSRMARLVGDKAYAVSCDAKAKALRKAINKELWIEEKGFYAQYLYGRNYSLLSPRSETLGEALCILFGVADSARQKTLVQENPIQAYGAPVFFLILKTNLPITTMPSGLLWFHIGAWLRQKREMKRVC